MRINRLGLMTFAAMSLTTAALADGPGFLKSADVNKDGVIDQTEFQASRDQWFQNLDTNKDGFITADELKAFGDQMHADWAKKHADANQGAGTTQPDNAPSDSRGSRMADHILKRVDTDHDGKISKVEFDTEGSAMFKRLDKNSDGKIASDEMPQHRWGHMAGMMFDRMDADGDGKVTKAEFSAAGDKMFQKLDKNGDGVIEKDEMQPSKHDVNGDMPPPPPADQAPTP